MNDSPFLIGVDCAVDPKNVGVATAEIRNGRVHLLSAERCSEARDPAAVLVEKVGEQMEGSALRRAVLIAFDSPLGWPAALGAELVDHGAGGPISSAPGLLFRRHTDLVIKHEVGQQSLDVGADRIARTAAATLGVLARVRERLGLEIPLAWDPREVEEERRARAIEVYPGATLRALGIFNRGYKKASDRDRRAEILGALAPDLSPGSCKAALLANADVLDAALSTVAAAHFLRGLCFEPRDLDLARKEGWMWVCRPAAR